MADRAEPSSGNSGSSGSPSNPPVSPPNTPSGPEAAAGFVVVAREPLSVALLAAKAAGEAPKVKSRAAVGTTHIRFSGFFKNIRLSFVVAGRLVPFGASMGDCK